jgi:periplasmic divalent cation tolerance protein
MTGLLLIRVNCPDAETAHALSATLIAEHLAPCTNLTGPVTATYVWQGEIETGEEWVLWVKAHEDAWPRIETVIKAEHPDDVPAILALPVSRVNASYAQWLVDNTDV